MVYTRFVEVGRVAVINHGPLAHKLCVIVDVVDANRVVVEGPSTGVPRQVVPITRLCLAKPKLNFRRGIDSKKLASLLEQHNIVKNFEASSWGQSLRRKSIRRNLTDFERFEADELKFQRRLERMDPKFREEFQQLIDSCPGEAHEDFELKCRIREEKAKQAASE